jgi:hypothetical protein
MDPSINPQAEQEEPEKSEMPEEPKKEHNPEGPEEPNEQWSSSQPEGPEEQEMKERREEPTEPVEQEEPEQEEPEQEEPEQEEPEQDEPEQEEPEQDEPESLGSLATLAALAALTSMAPLAQETPEDLEKPKNLDPGAPPAQKNETQDQTPKEEAPEESEKHEKPEEPEKPEQPEQPETPENRDPGFPPAQETETQDQTAKPEEPEEPEKQEKPERPENLDPGVPPAQKTETRDPAAAPGAPQNPQPSASAPDVQNLTAVERWARNLRDKIAAALQKPDATDAGSDKPADEQMEATTVEADKAEAAKPKAKLPELPALVDLSNLPLPVLPSMDIIAVHDLGQSLTTAWAYTPEKAFAKRPAAPARQPHLTVNPVSGLADPTQPLSPGRPSAVDMKTALKALGEAKDPDISGWSVEVTHHDGPAKGPNPESQRHAPVSSVPGADVARLGGPGGELDVASGDKGKGRADGEPSTPVLRIDASEGGERGDQPPTEQQPQPPTTDVTGERKPHDDGVTARPSRQSDRPSSNTGSKQPSEKDKGPKAGNWLTDPTMLAGDLDRARVLAFSYKSLEPTQPPQPTDNSPMKPDYDRYLEEMAEALLSKLKAERPDDLPKTPLVFIGTGFGCLIIQKLIVLIAKSEGPSRLSMIAALHFFDVPRPIAPEADRETSKPLFLLPPANSNRAPRMKAILESKAFDSWGLWLEFQACIKEWELSTVWYYTSAKVSSRTVCTPCVYLPLLQNGC